MKKCGGKCQLWKDESDFTRASKTKDGLQSYCRECMREYQKIKDKTPPYAYYNIPPGDRTISIIVRDELTINSITRDIEEKKQKFASGLKIADKDLIKFISQSPAPTEISYETFIGRKIKTNAYQLQQTDLYATVQRESTGENNPEVDSIVSCYKQEADDSQRVRGNYDASTEYHLRAGQ